MIIQKPVQSFSSGRGGMKPELVVIHIGEGSQQVIYNTFLTEEKSSHYCVSKTGEIWQFVSEADQAWTNGIVVNPTSTIVLSHSGINPNKYAISIEHEGFCSADATESQYQTTSNLVKEICTRWAIPIDRVHIIGHHEIRSDKTCPGLINVDKIVSLASGGLSKVEQAKQKLQESINLLS